MKIVPKDGPAINPVNRGKVTAAVSARDAAIAKLISGAPTQQPQQTPVLNPTSVAPEEMRAISSTSTHSSPESVGHENISEGTSVSESASAPSSEATKAPDKMISSEYAVLARKEKALRAKVQAQEAASKAREDALRAREEAIKAKEQEYQTNYIPKDRLAKDTLAVLNESGLDYDKITQLALNSPKPEELALMNQVRALEEKIAKLEGSYEKTQKTFEERDIQAYENVKAQMHSDAARLVKNNPEFETIDKTDSIADIVDLIEKTYNTDKVLLTVEEAAKEIEDHLIEEALKVYEINKIKSRLSPKKTEEAPKQSVQSQVQPQGIKTLTNQVASTRHLSTRERAILAAKGELK